MWLLRAMYGGYYGQLILDSDGDNILLHLCVGVQADRQCVVCCLPHPIPQHLCCIDYYGGNVMAVITHTSNCGCSYCKERQEELNKPTLRDQFAMAALPHAQSMCQYPEADTPARMAYQYADAMLKERG